MKVCRRVCEYRGTVWREANNRIFFIVKVVCVHGKYVNNTRKPEEENLLWTPTTPCRESPHSHLVSILLAFFLSFFFIFLGNRIKLAVYTKIREGLE